MKFLFFSFGFFCLLFFVLIFFNISFNFKSEIIKSFDVFKLSSIEVEDKELSLRTDLEYILLQIFKKLSNLMILISKYLRR